ncbi:hypothetical protein SAMN06265337_0643 [Hymenobacter gelipurpurascens]|uniref:Uncharacterized protein n=1 Tax=Hymenobacter gelipurpurascens TaxID=89968 RepID=A0A212T8E8_9BACT|nr:hypothetical protein [Hymenobacter gelipurpurascens]SNC62302.1 hypothetical protein SAMN06265337_0643 [Hymenobacter gelipurpurascens]
MILSPDQVRQLLQAPANAGAIEACLRHEQRLQLHAIAHMDPDRRPEGWRYIREYAQGLLPKDKFTRWQQCVPAPLPSTDVVEDISTGLRRVFEAQDGLVQCELATPELETDFETYRTQMRESEFWSGDAFQAIQARPHSLLVVDMAAEQRTSRPEPYVFLLELEQLYDVALRSDGTCEYVLFVLPERRQEGSDLVIERMACYDDAAYCIFEKPRGEQEWTEVLRNPHILGYCPARVLWDDAMDGVTNLARRAPLSSVLGSLDRYVFWDAAIEYYRLHGTFPIMWGFEQECGYKGGEGEVCQGGFVSFIKGYETLSNGEQRPLYSEKVCPSCAARELIGPGSYVEVPAPSKEMPDTRDPVGMVTPSVPVLEHVQLMQERRREALLRSVLGGGGEPSNEQAKNTKQVQGGFEIKQDVLVEFKKPIERARAWTLTTKGKLRYGPLYRGTFVSMGERFYLKTPEQLATEEAEARKAGRPVYELSQARDFRYQTQWRNNPAQLDRMRILSDLEPYPEYSVEQILTMIALATSDSNTMAKDLFDLGLMRLKVDFGRYLTRFESEQMDVRRFASLQPYHIKLESITSFLLSYVNESPKIANRIETSGKGETRPQNAPEPAA